VFVPPLILAAISLLLWIALTFFRGAFWRFDAFDDDHSLHSAPREWPRVVAVVPARNEAATIERAITSLAGQNYKGHFQIIVVDDHSEDRTAALAEQVALSGGGRGRVTVLSASALEGGWTGKLWALEQGLAEARTQAPDYFWFTDADIVHRSDRLERLVTRAESDRLDLVSLMVLLETRSFAERLLIPPFLYFFLKLYPPRSIADPKSGVAGAAGGCLLLRRAALEHIGGLARIRAEVIDDCALARVVKQSGRATWMGLTRTSVSLRSYQTFGEIRDLVARTAFTQLRYSAPRLLATLVGMLATYVVPVVFSFVGGAVVWRTSLAAWVLMTVTYVPTVCFYGLSPLWAPTLPVAAIFYSYATWLSAWRYWLGRGGQWKGRAQAATRIPNDRTGSAPGIRL
jgi:hopene-associated glycosyltransferase HpnB